MIVEPLKVLKSPCSSCPYRKDVPPGVWHESEYEKLRGYDDNSTLGVFLCHHTSGERQTVCRGWLYVHQDSVAARLACATGAVTVDQLFAEVPVECYGSGNEAADAGLAGVEKPTVEAVLMGRKIRAAKQRRTRKGKGI